MIIERILKTYINWEYINKLLDNAILVWISSSRKCVLNYWKKLWFCLFNNNLYIFMICSKTNFKRRESWLDHLPVW